MGKGRGQGEKKRRVERRGDSRRGEERRGEERGKQSEGASFCFVFNCQGHGAQQASIFERTKLRNEEANYCFRCMKLPVFEREVQNSTGLLKRFKALFEHTKLTGF